jgi:hypothetical protein
MVCSTDAAARTPATRQRLAQAHTNHDGWERVESRAKVPAEDLQSTRARQTAVTTRGTSAQQLQLHAHRTEMETFSAAALLLTGDTVSTSGASYTNWYVVALGVRSPSTSTSTGTEPTPAGAVHRSDCSVVESTTTSVHGLPPIHTDVTPGKKFCTGARHNAQLSHRVRPHSARA